jgi:alpha-L-rhamnosidase
VASCFIKGIGGIRNEPGHFGYKRFVIKPHLVGDLTFAAASMELLYGRIVSKWTRKDGMMTLHVEVPPNSSAKIYLPTGDRKSIIESGKSLEEAKGVTFLGMEDGRAVLSVASGHYSFVSK